MRENKAVKNPKTAIDFYSNISAYRLTCQQAGERALLDSPK